MNPRPEPALLRKRAAAIAYARTPELREALIRRLLFDLREIVRPRDTHRERENAVACRVVAASPLPTPAHDVPANRRSSEQA